MKKKLLMILSFVVAHFVFIGILIGTGVFLYNKKFHPYNPEDFIGKSKTEIVEKYGEFYFVEEDPTTGRITCGRYYIEDFITFVFGGRNEVRALYFVVHFDKNDIADNAYEKYGLPGG